ncbi:hypothetical protein ACH5RR_038268 [Cinchona calisaya]|uniref:BTB domain-containing protein n=1 Tax=Cinchona calisaya TaxID=153742 RepID=A0ABD2XY12_9GENT
MDEETWSNSFEFGDQSTSDVILYLRNKEGRPEVLHAHSSILKKKSKNFANKLSQPNSSTQIEIQCTESDYDHYVELVKRLYCPIDLLLNSWDTVRSAIGVLQVSALLQCEEVTDSCIQYLEAVPWEDKEEEEILKAASNLGQIAMPILARIQPVDINATKNVFVSAFRFATSNAGPCPPFGDELKTSAQEQIDYMLGDDEGVPLITADDDVKLEARTGLSKLCSYFKSNMSLLLLESEITYESAEKKVMQSLSDLEWMCNVLPKMDLMKDLVANWVDISDDTLVIIEDKKLDSVFWGLKIKLIEVTAKVLEAVGYGTVILPAQCRVHLLKTWLPYIRKMKPLLDSMADKETEFPYKMDEDLCQSIEGAMVSLILALPSNDQADILVDWMSAEQVKYPDLSEAFEVWCYRTKSAKRRLVEGLDHVGNTTVSL